MNSTLFNGYSGIKTHQFGLDSTSNNIANINTTGYRANMPEFKSIFSQALNTTNPASSVKSDMNYGSTAASNAISNVNGNFKESEGELNIAYAGKGWFIVGDNENENFNINEPNANAKFTRDGSFSRDAEGYIVNASGHYMLGIDLGKIQNGIFISNPQNDAANLATSEVKPIAIPQDLHFGPTETTRVNLALNLNPNEAILPSYEIFKNEDGNIDEAQIKNQDINSLIINNENINARVYSDIILRVGGEEFTFNYGDEGENSFKTFGQLMDLINNQTGLKLDFMRDSSGNIDKNINLELKNNGLNSLEVSVSGKLAERLNLNGTKKLENLNIKDFSPNGFYNINDLARVGGAIFKRVENAGNSNPIEDRNAWILVDSLEVDDYNEQENYANGALVHRDGRIYAKISDENLPLNDDGLNWQDLGADVELEIAQYSPDESYGRNSFVYFNNNIYQKISDNNGGAPNTDILNWKILDRVNFLSPNLNMANYKTTTEIFDENGDKMQLISHFVLKDSSENKIWEVKSAIYSKDGDVALSPIVTHEIGFDSAGNVISGEDIELQLGEKTITYSILGSDNKKSTNFSYMDSSLLEASKDGSQKGELANIGIDSNGIINLSFTNGITEPIGRVGIAAFVNDQGLQKVGGNLFELSAMSVDGGEAAIASGAPIIGWDENGALRFGQVLHKYLETSNVNAADAMTDLIVYQRGYSMNAKAFTTGDDLIKEAINLKRN